ncbi:hypothetical protein KR200_002450, partial [Drosophila serrata]
PNICLILQMEDLDAQERFEYVVDKYKKANINIDGKPLGLHGKVVSNDLEEEIHIVFHYVDNTLHDVIQTCTVVISDKPNECESIRTYCSGFLRRPPRPLLELKPLIVCKDKVQVAKEEPELGTEPEVEAVPEADPITGEPTEADTTKAPDDDKAPSSKF